MSRSSPSASSRRVAVRLQANDWNDLCHFVYGDLQNMEEGDSTKDQMRRIIDAIQRAIAKSENEALQRPDEVGSVARSGSPAKRESGPQQSAEAPRSPAKREID